MFFADVNSNVCQVQNFRLFNNNAGVFQQTDEFY